MIARLDLLQGMIVIDVLRCIVEVNEDLGVAIWEKAVDGVSVFDAFEVNEHVNELVEREDWNVSFVDHLKTLKNHTPVCS